MIAIRPAAADDMPSFAAVVNPYIEKTSINFRMAPQSADDWAADWEKLHEWYPWLVAEIDDEIAGIAYAGPWKARNAYDWCAEATVYVAETAHRRGVGRALYDRLLGILDDQGYRSTVGVIALPNAASVGLHEAAGFVHAGTLRSVGHKMGEWRDVGFWQRVTGGDGDAPPTLRTVAEVSGAP